MHQVRHDGRLCTKQGETTLTLTLFFSEHIKNARKHQDIMQLDLCIWLQERVKNARKQKNQVTMQLYAYGYNFILFVLPANYDIGLALNSSDSGHKKSVGNGHNGL
jgi:hypothetical protein